MDPEEELNLDENSNINYDKDDQDGCFQSENDIKIKKDIILVHIEKNQRKITELIPDVDIGPCINTNNEIILGKLIEMIKQIGFPIDQNMVHYWCQDAEMFMYCGIDPLPEDITIPIKDYLDVKELKIKCKENPISLIHQIMSEDINDINNKSKDCNQQEKKETKNNCRRTKERKIGFIIEKVVEWRNYHNGIADASGKSCKLSLDEAANKVEISKKSLDDYLLQIRSGRRYNFNFNEHKNDKVGILRTFVKKHKYQENGDKPKKRKDKKGEGIQSKNEEEEQNN